MNVWLVDYHRAGYIMKFTVSCGGPTHAVIDHVSSSCRRRRIRPTGQQTAGTASFDVMIMQ